jgi:Ca2+-binding RTX toxin-like protein
MLLNGTTADDILFAFGSGDTLNGGNGNDVLVGSSVETSDEVNAYNIRQNPDTLVTVANAWILADASQLIGDTLNGGAGNDLLYGSMGNDTLNGDIGDDFLEGDAGSDSLNGGEGNDTLMGGWGNDVLTGGNGVDHFRFDHTLSASSNVDTITDFISGVDKIDLSKSFMSDLGSLGVLSSSAFYSSAGSSSAHDSDDRIIYNTTTGALYYDSDGLGGSGAIQIAIIGAETHPVLIYSDLNVV